MKFEIPLPLQREHEALHRRLRKASRLPGEVGDLAEAVARLMHSHFAREDRIAMPPLGLLDMLAHGEPTPEMAGVLELTDELEAELPAMLAEHRMVVEALQHLRDVAEGGGHLGVADLAQQLVQHASMEEAVMYPAAILVGKVVRRSLGVPAPARQA